ncbi:MAG: Acyl-CoA thioester hydrolase [Myxococcales bacterium]|nr:Acyl-CoA thioester hydrolase [Myxococcales bacterium]
MTTAGGKPPAASRVEMTEIVLPGDTNALGTIFGGKVMQWIDIAASVAGMRHSGGNVVTASIDGLTFLTPIHLGEIVLLQAQVNFVGRTSMEIGVRVEAEDPRTAARRYTTKAYLTFVAIDADGKPRPIAPLVPENDEDRRRCQDALARRDARLASRAARPALRDPRR